jgi:hypothetical protein
MLSDYPALHAVYNELKALLLDYPDALDCCPLLRAIYQALASLAAEGAGRAGHPRTTPLTSPGPRA